MLAPLTCLSLAKRVNAFVAAMHVMRDRSINTQLVSAQHSVLQCSFRSFQLFFTSTIHLRCASIVRCNQDEAQTSCFFHAHQIICAKSHGNTHPAPVSKRVSNESTNGTPTFQELPTQVHVYFNISALSSDLPKPRKCLHS